MIYFLTVKNKADETLHSAMRFERLEDALQLVSDHYLEDAREAQRWTGYFAMRGAEITRLYIQNGTAGMYLRQDIALIDIVSARGRLELETEDAPLSD